MQAHDQRHVHTAGVAVGDERRHDVHQLLTAVEQTALGGKLMGQCVEIVVREHDALGRTGGAAGVHHHAGVLRVVGFGVHALVFAGRDEVLPVEDVGFVAVAVGVRHLVADGQMQRQRVCRADDQHPLHAGALGGLVAALVGDVQADEQAGAHFLNVLVDALGAVARVHQIQRGTDHVGGVEGVNDLRGHDADHGDDIALLHADAAEGGGRLFHVDDQVCKGDLAAIVFQRSIGQVVLVLAADVLKGRTLRQGQVNELLVVVFQPGLRSGRIERFTLFSSHRIKSSFLSSFHC